MYNNQLISIAVKRPLPV